MLTMLLQVAAADEQMCATASYCCVPTVGTVFEIGSWLLYWEALNAEDHIETGMHQNDVTMSNKNKQHNQHIYDLSVFDGGEGAACASSAAAAVTAHMVCTNQRPRVLARQQLMRLKLQHSSAGNQNLSVVVDTGSLTQHGHTVCPQPSSPRVLEVPGATAATAVGTTAGQDGENKAVREGDNKANTCPFQNNFAVMSSHSQQGYINTLMNGLQTWCWWGLRFHDMGFTASFLQLIGATIFWVRAHTTSRGSANIWAEISN